jgi:hypothetical protein
MSQVELEKYKKLYSTLVEAFVELHNLNLSYVNYVGIRTGYSVRRQLKKILLIKKELDKSTKLVYSEYKNNEKARQELSKRNRDIAKKLHQEGLYKNDKRFRTNKDDI